MANKKIHITRDGGLYTKPSDLLKDPDVRKKMKKFAKIMEECTEENKPEKVKD